MILSLGTQVHSLPRRDAPTVHDSMLISAMSISNLLSSSDCLLNCLLTRLPEIGSCPGMNHELCMLVSFPVMTLAANAIIDGQSCFCLLQARGAPRQNATAKDSEWVRTRQALEKDKPPDINEVFVH